MLPARTPSFVAEIPLRAGSRELRAVVTRLEVGRQLYNACLREAAWRVKRLRSSSEWTEAQALPSRTKAQRQRRDRALRRARRAFVFNDYALQHFAVDVLRKSGWMSDHLGVHEVQKLGTRAYRAANGVLLGKGRHVRFKGSRQFDTLEGKSNKAGIRWRRDRIEWHGLVLPALMDPQDLTIAYALEQPVKYVRIVRRRIRGTPRLYAQLICRGRPYRKAKHNVASDHVGLDLGPTTVAVVGERDVILTQLCGRLVRHQRQIRVLQRRADRQRRANNLGNYGPDGQLVRGAKRWRFSRRALANLDKIAELYRREKSHRKSLHGELVNKILATGSLIHTETFSARALQRIFGRSVSRHAPGTFLEMLRRKAESAGGQFIKIPAWRAKLSQTCHNCGAIRKKSLSERVHACGCGVVAQRDLYSAFLARHTDAEGTLHVDEARRAWSGADPLLRAAWRRALQPAIGRSAPSTFGRAPFDWSRSGLLAKERIANADAQGVIALGEATAVPLSTPRR